VNVRGENGSVRAAVGTDGRTVTVHVAPALFGATVPAACGVGLSRDRLDLVLMPGARRTAPLAPSSRFKGFLAVAWPAADLGYAGPPAPARAIWATPFDRAVLVCLPDWWRGLLNDAVSDRALLGMWAAGDTIGHIAYALSCEATVVHRRLRHLGVDPAAARAPAPRVARRCLRCGGGFTVASPYLRLCSACRRESDRRSTADQREQLAW